MGVAKELLGAAERLVARRPPGVQVLDHRQELVERLIGQARPNSTDGVRCSRRGARVKQAGQVEGCTAEEEGAGVHVSLSRPW